MTKRGGKGVINLLMISLSAITSENEGLHPCYNGSVAYLPNITSV